MQEASGAGAARPRIMLRRLTHSQYNNTVRDLLGDRSLPANQFPPEDFVNGFKNQYASQNLSPLLEDAYSAAAEKLARTAFRAGNAHNPVTCPPSPACRVAFIQSFGLHAFRRPLDAAEAAPLRGSVSEAAGLSPRAPNSSSKRCCNRPTFCSIWKTRTIPNRDPTPPRAGSPTRSGIRCPTTRCSPPPDAANWTRPEGVARAARRMLDDPKAHQALDEFVGQWLRFDRVLTATKERRAFPQFTPDTALAMTQEARRFVSGLVWGNRDFTELFTAADGYPNGDLARIYGVEPPANDFDRVPFPANSERAGLLGQALFLTLTAKPDETSPTARGLFVREQFLCQHVADPPPGVNTNLPPVTRSPADDQPRPHGHARHQQGLRRLPQPGGPHRLRLREVRCHRPAARQAEADLRRRASAKARGARPKLSTVELDLDTKGQVAGIPNSSFASPKELGAVLAASPQCQECVVKQYFRYVAGRTETPADRPLIRRVFEDFRRSGFRFQEMIISMMRARETPGPEISRGRRGECRR